MTKSQTEDWAAQIEFILTIKDHKQLAAPRVAHFERLAEKSLSTMSHATDMQAREQSSGDTAMIEAVVALTSAARAAVSALKRKQEQLSVRRATFLRELACNFGATWAAPFFTRTAITR